MHVYVSKYYFHLYILLTSCVPSAYLRVKVLHLGRVFWVRRTPPAPNISNLEKMAAFLIAHLCEKLDLIG
jgi:hypothetical protein